MNGTPIIERLRDENYALAAEAADLIDFLQAQLHASEKRAEEMEARIMHLADERDEARSSLGMAEAALRNIVECHDMACEIYTNDHDMAENFAAKARAALHIPATLRTLRGKDE